MLATDVETASPSFVAVTGHCRDIGGKISRIHTEQLEGRRQDELAVGPERSCRDQRACGAGHLCVVVLLAPIKPSN